MRQSGLRLGGLGRGRAALFWVPLLLAHAAPVGCSETRLQVPQKEVVQPKADDELAITGTYCASPAADVAFPVKVMFVVDGSGSQQFTDQNRQRAVAVEKAINELLGAPNIDFKTVVFNATVTAEPPAVGTGGGAVFTSNASVLVTALGNLAEADTLTDYQGALAVVYSELIRDMEAVRTDPLRGPAELRRTKYVVIFISDGMPDPQCRAGLCNDVDPNFPEDEDCGGLQINLLCEDTAFIDCLLQRDDYDDSLCYRQDDYATLFGGFAAELVGGADYNQPYQILDKIDAIMELQERYEVGEIRVHTALVLDPYADPQITAIFGDPTQAIPLMQQMSEIGQGEYMEFYGGDEIDFLDINYDAIKQPRVVRGFFVTNRAAMLTEEGLGIDTDFDGLTDQQEFEIGTDMRTADTDGDGYTDIVEWRRRGLGFDAHDPCRPPIVDVAGMPPSAVCDPAAPMNCDFTMGTHPQTGNPMRVYADIDSDGLHDCEERQIGTDPRQSDSDSDGIPDRVEYVYGLDPLRWDTDRDDDQDGVPNGHEIEWHLNPTVEQNDRDIRERYRYNRPQVGTTVDGRPCYEFAVRRIRLVPTKKSRDLGLNAAGYNEIRLFLVESMADDLGGVPLIRTACLRPRYVPPNYKLPPSGEVELVESDLRYLFGQDPIFNDDAVMQQIFNPSAHCVRF